MGKPTLTDIDEPIQISFQVELSTEEEKLMIKKLDVVNEEVYQLIKSLSIRCEFNLKSNFANQNDEDYVNNHCVRLVNY